MRVSGGLLLDKLKEVLNLLGFSAVRQEYRISIISLHSGTKARARKTPRHDKTYEKARERKRHVVITQKTKGNRGD